MDNIDKKLQERFGKNGNEKSFDLPENYFNSFSERLAERIIEEKAVQKQEDIQEETAVLSLYERLKPFVTLAAVFCGFGLFAYLPFTFMSNTKQLAQAEQTEVSLEEVMDEYYFSNETVLIGDLTTEDETQEEAVTNEDIEAYFVAELSSYEIADYYYEGQ